MSLINYNEIIYSLSIADIQDVAEQEIERTLTQKEIESILDLVAENIPWYDAIADAIQQKISQNNLSTDNF